MKDQSKTKQVLIQELASLRQRISELEQSESEREQAKDKLRESEARFRYLLQSVPNVAVQGYGPDGTTQYWNQASERLYGYTAQEAIGRNLVDLIIPPEMRGDVEQAIQQMVETRQPIPASELFLMRKDGSRVAVISSHAVVQVPGREPELFCIDIDLTERKWMEEALCQSEKNFRHSLDDFPLGVRIVTIEGETIYANRAILDIYGFDNMEDLKTTPVEKRYTPESFAEYQIRREKRKRGGDTPPEYEISIVRKDGKVRHLHVFRKEILWDGERQYQVLYNDITQSKQAEDTLRESEVRFAIIFNASPAAIAVTRLKDGHLIDVNSTWQKVTGYSREEAIGRTPIELNSWVNPGERDRLIHTLHEHGMVTNFLFQVRHKTGNVFEMLMSAELIVIADERYILSLAQDITEQKKVQERLKDSEELYRSLFEVAVVGISQASPDGRLIHANMAYARMYGYASPDEMRAEVTNVGQLYANPEERQKVLSILNEKGVMEPREFLVVRRDGTRFTVLVGAREIRDSKGNLRYYQAEHIDITARKQAEAELTTSHKQLRALATRLQQIREEERTMIAREIHDEMGGGLTGLKMDLSWLLRKIGDTDPGEARVALMDKIHASNASIDRMIHLVRRISTDLRPSVLDDLGLIAALEWQLSEFTSRTEIPHEFATTFEYVNMAEDTAVAVFRIFQEALTNVVRHARASKVAVVLREGEMSLFGDETLVLEIRDNGRGITEEEIRSSESLGLLGMKERVLTFGGALSIRGEPGGGTALVLKIPRKQGKSS